MNITFSLKGPIKYIHYTSYVLHIDILYKMVFYEYIVHSPLPPIPFPPLPISPFQFPQIVSLLH